ncbi:unnamed protein product [Orchesella dallaii]|uniref:Uncharacterized protein n=1 Tax=Orchesella dallaii TaxID=48710 RepID=A0ABP1R327_9HEXA
MKRNYATDEWLIVPIPPPPIFHPSMKLIPFPVKPELYLYILKLDYVIINFSFAVSIEALRTSSGKHSSSCAAYWTCFVDRGTPNGFRSTLVIVCGVKALRTASEVHSSSCKAYWTYFVDRGTPNGFRSTLVIV